MNRSLVIILLLLLATVVGCQQGVKPLYANVQGTVKHNGQLIEKGQITFAFEGHPPSTMDITDGKFAGQAMIGSNKIMVSAKKKSATAPKLPKSAETQIKGYMEKRKGESGGPPMDYDPTMVEAIPADWNTDSKQMRVVESGAANDFQFDIKGNAKPVEYKGK
jgi:hypothetical protein